MCAGIPSVVIPGCAEGAGPESITTIGSMDSGLVLRTPRNDEGERAERKMENGLLSHFGKGEWIASAFARRDANRARLQHVHIDSMPTDCASTGIAAHGTYA